MPSSFMTLGWSSRRRNWISLAMNRTLSESDLLNHTFLSATIRPVPRSRALYTLLYEPSPTFSIFSYASTLLVRASQEPGG